MHAIMLKHSNCRKAKANQTGKSTGSRARSAVISGETLDIGRIYYWDQALRRGSRGDTRNGRNPERTQAERAAGYGGVIQRMDDSAEREQEIGEGGSVELRPEDIRYSQSSVNGSREIIESMEQNGWKGPPIDVVEMLDGRYTTIDNTRVVAAKKVGIKVQAIIHNYDDRLPQEYVERFRTRAGTPETWGEAIIFRIGKQKQDFRENYPSGSYVMPNIQ